MKSPEAPGLKFQLLQAWMWVEPSLTLLSQQLFLPHRSQLARHVLVAALRDYYLPITLLPQEENRNETSQSSCKEGLTVQARGVP